MDERDCPTRKNESCKLSRQMIENHWLAMVSYEQWGINQSIWVKYHQTNDCWSICIGKSKIRTLNKNRIEKATPRYTPSRINNWFRDSNWGEIYISQEKLLRIFYMASDHHDDDHSTHSIYAQVPGMKTTLNPMNKIYILILPCNIATPGPPLSYPRIQLEKGQNQRKPAKWRKDVWTDPPIREMSNLSFIILWPVMTTIAEPRKRHMIHAATKRTTWQVQQLAKGKENHICKSATPLYTP